MSLDARILSNARRKDLLHYRAANKRRNLFLGDFFLLFFLFFSLARVSFSFFRARATFSKLEYKKRSMMMRRDDNDTRAFISREQKALLSLSLFARRKRLARLVLLSFFVRVVVESRGSILYESVIY